MTINFIGQPIDAQIGPEIRRLLAEPSTTSARFLVAWAKYSGLRRIANAAEAAVARGVDLEVVVGIDEGGATVQGLRALIGITSRAFVFHNPSQPKRTFHPKIYLFDSTDSRTAIVGSGNLTMGGLYGNYEAATIATSPAGDGTLNAYLDQVDRYYKRIRDDRALCKPLDEALVEALAADPRIILGDERRRPRRRSADDGATLPPSIFGASDLPLADIPPADESGRGTEAQQTESDEESDDSIALIEFEAGLDDTESESDAGPLGPDSPRRGFYKRLSRNDVSLTGSPGQIIIPIRFMEFFGEPSDQSDRLRRPGPGQVGIDGIPTVFHGGGTTTELMSRVIVYTPAPDQPRPNPEVRFTFHDRATLESLSAGDYLEFTWQGETLHITRTTTSHPARYDWIAEANVAAPDE